MKQTIGYLIIDGKDIPVLVRTKKYARSLKIRRGGCSRAGGMYLEDESIFLAENRGLLKQLLDGKTISI